MNHLMWVLVTESFSFGRLVGTLNHWVVSIDTDIVPFFKTIIRLTEKLSRKSRISHFFLLPIMPFLLLIHLLSAVCFHTYNIALIAIVNTVFSSWYYTLHLSQRKL